jgi:acyl carrier protein
MPAPSYGDSVTWFRNRLAKAAEPPRDPAAVHATDHLRDDLAIDSLAFIELMVDFEEAFGVRLDEKDLLPSRYQTVKDLTSWVSQCLTTK